MIAIGEAAVVLTAEAKPGTWYAYAKPVADDDDFSELTCIHADHARDFAKLRTKNDALGEVAIEGASLTMFEAAIADDTEVIGELQQTGTGVLVGRAAKVCLGGDGRAKVKVARANGLAICVRADLT
ncbi:MAG: hypothetical protein QM831_39390 [Kofleriaceae bacterium]